MNDFNRIRQNVELMASHNAPEKDIDGYLATEGLTPDKFKSQMSQVPSDPGRMELAAKYSAGSGVANLIDSVPRAVVGAGNLVRMGTGYLGNKLGLLSADQMPEPIDPNMLDIANPVMRQAGLINDNYAPTDKAGRVLDTTVQTLTGGGINPSAIIRNGAQGLIKPVVRDIVAPTLSGTAMGVANVATDGLDTGNESLNTALRTGAALVAGSVAGAPVAMRGTAGDRAAAALKSVSPEQLALAKTLQQKAATNGSPITGYEAIQAVTGLNPKMQTQQRLAEQSDAAGGGLTTMMQNRPVNNATLFAKTADTIAPVPASPDAVAGKLKNAAEAAIQNARNQGNAKAGPFYATSSNDPNVKLPSQDWNQLVSDPAIAWALDQTKRNPLLGVHGATEGSLQWLDTAKKFLDSHSQSLAQSGDRFPAGQASAASKRITSAVDPLFPDYAKARNIVAQNTRDVVTPMEQGQIGKLASTDNFGTQAGNLLPESPMDVNPSVVSKTMSTIGAEDPTIGPTFLAQYLRGTFNEANQKNVAGDNVFGGAKFAAKVSGNPTQEANLTQAIASSGGDPKALADALEIYRAQGMKPPVNSATFANASEGKSLLSHVNPLPWLASKGEHWANGWATSDLARALIDPNSIDELTGLARINGSYSPLKQNALANLLISQQPQ